MQINSFNQCNNENFYQNIVNKIPDEPKILIPNYLLDLICDEDGKEKSIYLNDASSLIKEIWDEIIKNNWRDLKVKKFIPNKLNITASVFYGYKNGRKNISISTLYSLIKIWQNFCNKNEKEAVDKWNDVYNRELSLSTHSRCQKTSLPRYINPKLSYLLGWICGDGNFHRGNHYCIKISEKSKNQLEMVLKPLFMDIFKVKPQIFKRCKNGYAIQIGSKSIFRFLKNVIKIQVGHIPSIVNYFDLINKKHFLIGLFDAEGYVNPRYLDSVITISQNDKLFLEKVKFLFYENNIKFIGPHEHKTNLGIWYTLKIRKKEEILKFIDSISSYHIDKLKRLEKLRYVIEKNWNC
jgi:hypothetical protein